VPTEIRWRQNTYHPQAGYRFRPLRPYAWRDWRSYWNRRVRYGLRELQIPEIDDIPLTELPATMDAINRRILGRLDSQPPTWMDFVGRAVHRRLRRMYPTPVSG